MITFDEIFEAYCAAAPAAKDTSHKPNQIREKYVEIATAAGVNLSLLKQYRDPDTNIMVTPQGPNAPYQFPDDDEEFVLRVLMEHTSSSSKNLRRANFSDAPLEDRKALVKGFCDILEHLGHDAHTVEQQRENMERRMYIALDTSTAAFQKCLLELKSRTEEAVGNLGLLYEDRVLLLEVATQRCAETCNNLEALIETYRDIRVDEASDIALEETPLVGSPEETRFFERLHVEDALEGNPEYTALCNQKMDLMYSDAFVKQKMGKWDAICKKMEQIQAQTEMKLLGHRLEPEGPGKARRKPPKQVLQEAIQDMEEAATPLPAAKPLSPEEHERCRRIIAEFQRQWETKHSHTGNEEQEGN